MMAWMNDPAPAAAAAAAKLKVETKSWIQSESDK
jgi:hypothetical protein